MSLFGITERESRVGKLGWHENFIRNLREKIIEIDPPRNPGEFCSRKTKYGIQQKAKKMILLYLLKIVKKE